MGGGGRLRSRRRPRALAKLFSQNIEIADDLLARVVSVTDGTVRRVVTNIDRIVQWAKRTGKQKVDLAVG